MLDTYATLLDLVEDIVIRGIFFSVTLIILVKLLSNNKIETEFSTQIVRWILVLYAIGVLLNITLMLTFNK